MRASVFTRPSAVAPVAMSVAALALVLGHVALFGIVHETDEGTPAHLYQLLMAGQVPVIGYFVLRYLPEAPARAIWVLIAQVAAAAAAFGALYWMESR
ncbi:MAG: hypothetical protein ABIX28_00790 [Vicinamibacterales bacterium]